MLVGVKSKSYPDSCHVEAKKWVLMQGERKLAPMKAPTKTLRCYKTAISRAEGRPPWAISRRKQQTIELRFWEDMPTSALIKAIHSYISNHEAEELAVMSDIEAHTHCL